MSQPIVYNNTFNDNSLARRYTGYPLNSTLVSSYTPDTIRSIITHAASGQPYSTAVWIRISRVGIQVSAQDSQVARTRIPVFIPIGLTHDIFMLPSINNVICIVYDEIKSNMKGILLYVVHPSDAQLIRDDFRIVKQANNSQTQMTYTSPPIDNNQLYSPITSPSLNNSSNIRQSSPRRLVYVRENDSNPITPQITYTPTKERRRHRSPRKHRSPAKRSVDNVNKESRKHKSRSPEKQIKNKLAPSRSSPELAREEIQQQQLAAWQAQQQQQQMPMIPMGIYNRYVPKTIPLPNGETIKTTLPPAGMNGTATNGVPISYVEPITNASTFNRSQSRSPSPSRRQHSRHRRHHTNDASSRQYSKVNTTVTTDDDDDVDTKQYLKLLVDEMKAMKLEMNKLRSLPLDSPTGSTKGRSDSIQVDLKELRSHIDTIRQRMAMTPLVPKTYTKQ